MPDANDLITLRKPPPNRVGKSEGGLEKHFSEPAVMLAYITYLIEQHPELNGIEIHPDGEHGKQFDIRAWLERRGYTLVEPQGNTSYGGRYRNGDRSVLVSLQSGQGDVVGYLGGTKIVAECKGGIVNTKHPGQKSKLRRGLCEAVGLLMSRDNTGERQYAVVPLTDETQRLANQMRARCRKAGIEIVLIREDGSLV
ncbi:hypothetical protein JXA85_04935 [Candidatus Woesearchaeota archaeon]|nr:hypothetical protein [Candidatus Woesearchaeota archaeon]